MVSAKAEDILLKAFVESIEDGIRGSQFEDDGRGRE